MTPKREQNTAIREWNRGYEARCNEAGRRMVTARLSPSARRQLEALQAQHQCSVRDVIEGLLFGNIDPTRTALKLSPSEIECARALGVRL